MVKLRLPLILATTILAISCHQLIWAPHLATIKGAGADCWTGFLADDRGLMDAYHFEFLLPSVCYCNVF